MRKLLFSLVLTIITLSSQMEAMWLSGITRSLARNAAQWKARTTNPTLFRSMMPSRPLATPKILPTSRILNVPQTSVLNQRVEPHRSLLQNPTFRSHWEQSHQSRNYSNFAQKLAESSENAQSWYAYLFGIGAAATSAAFSTDSDDEKSDDSIFASLIRAALENGNFKTLNFAIKNPYIKERIIKIIIQNPDTFKALCESWYGKDFLNKLVDKNPQAAQPFTSAITQNPDTFKALYESSYGKDFLYKLIDKNPQVAQQFTSAITQNPDTFKALCESWNGADFLKNLVDKNPQVAQQVISAIIQNLDTFKSLCESGQARDFLKNLVDKNPQVAQQFTSAITQNFDTFKSLCKSWQVQDFLNNLVDNNAQAAQQFTSAITQNFDRFKSLCESFSGQDFLNKLVDNNAHAAQQFASFITQNLDRFKALCKSSHGSRFLNNLVDKNPQAAQQFYSVITQNLDIFIALCCSSNGPNLLRNLVDKNQQAAQQFTSFITQNLDTFIALCVSSDGPNFLRNLVDKNPHAAQQFTSFITQDPDIFKALCTSRCGPDFLNTLVDNNAQAAQQFTSFIIQNPDTFNRVLYSNIVEHLLKNLVANNPNAFINLFIKNLDQFSQLLKIITSSNPEFSKTLIKEIQELCKTNDFGNSEKFIKLFQLCLEASSSQTTQHLQHNFKRIRNSSTVKNYMDNKRLNNTYHKELEKEKELQSNGFVTFIHGQRRDYYLPELVYTFLWQIAKNKKVDNFVFAHVKQPATNPAHEQATLEQLRKNGRNTNDDRQRLLFLNYAFFGNDSNPGSNTAEYVKDNNNVGKIQNSFADIFNYFGFKNIYEHYKNQLEELQQQYKELSPEGTLLLIGVPQNKVNDVVYSAKPGGYKRPIYIEGIGKTDDTRLILETLRYHPEKIKDIDKIEFCLIMTGNGGGLDPESGIQIHPIVPCDNEEDLQKLEAERKELFEQIAQDIQKYRQSIWGRMWPF